MFSLLMVLMSVVMFSAVTLVTMNYIPVDALVAHKARTKAQTGMQALAAGAVRYIKTVTDVDGVTSLPAPGTDLASIIQPAFAFIPAPPAGMAWSVTSANYSGLPAIAICLYPTASVDEVIARGAASIQNQFPPSAMFVANTCQSQANGAGSHVTYWVVASHTTGV